jgi:Rhs element Vgr protein
MSALYITLGEESKKLATLEPLWFSSEQRVNAIPQGQLMLSVQGNSLDLGLYNDDIELCKPGGKISIYIEQEQKRKLVFFGIIVAQSLKLDRKKAELMLTLRHPIARLDSICRSQVFSETTATKIVTNFFSELGLPCKNSAKMMDTKQEQLVQFRCSDWVYTRRLLDENAAWLIPDFQNLKIIQPKLASKPDHALKRNNVNSQSTDQGKDPVIEANWQFNDQYQPKELELTAWNITKQQLISATASPEKLGQNALDPAGQKPLNAATWVVGSSLSISQQELEARAQSTLQQLQEAGVRGQFKIDGSLDYQLGETLALSGFGKGFDGYGIITTIAHDCNSSKWTTVISLGMRDATFAPPVFPTIKGLHIGVVANFEPDPDNLDRVRVRLPLLADSKDTNNNVLWARLAMPNASNGSGFYFYPSPGDEVVVAFVEDDPRFPIIVGSTYNPQNKPPVPMSKENAFKGMSFKGKDKNLLLQFNTELDSTIMAAEKDQTLQGGIVIKSGSAESAVEIKAKKINLEN